MGYSVVLISRVMSFSINKMSWVDPYLDFGCTTSEDTPLINVSGWKGVRYFSNEMIYIYIII